MKNNNVKETVLAYATDNEELATEIQKAADGHSLTSVVRLDSSLLETLRKADDKEKKPQTVNEFISNEDNKNEAEKKALYLWNLLTVNRPVEEADKRIFTKTEVVKRTTLTHRTLGDLLELFRLFGFIEFTKGVYEFRFVFSQQTKQDNAYADIVEDIRLLNMNIARYKNLLSADEFTEKWDKLRENITQLISF